MQASTFISLRANLVFIALCVAASDAAWLTICECSSHPHALESPFVHLATLACAALIVIAVRHVARLAFDAARASRRIAWSHDTAERLIIASPSSRNWLIQLHVELHPAQARRSVPHACSRATPSSRRPRSRA